MRQPYTYTNQNETGCCSVPNVEEWNERTIRFNDKPFIRMYTKSFLHVPLNMSKIMTALQQTATDAGVTMPPQEVLILSREISPWKAEQLYEVREPVPGADNVSLSGEFLTKVYEGPFKHAKQWHDDLIDYTKSRGKTPQDVYFFYTTCPKCAKYYGKNYVIGLAKT